MTRCSCLYEQARSTELKNCSWQLLILWFYFYSHCSSSTPKYGLRVLAQLKLPAAKMCMAKIASCLYTINAVAFSKPSTLEFSVFRFALYSGVPVKTDTQNRKRSCINEALQCFSGISPQKVSQWFILDIT